LHLAVTAPAGAALEVFAAEPALAVPDDFVACDLDVLFVVFSVVVVAPAGAVVAAVLVAAPAGHFT
jgi:hypothetical protein